MVWEYPMRTGLLTDLAQNEQRTLSEVGCNFFGETGDRLQAPLGASTENEKCRVMESNFRVLADLVEYLLATPTDFAFVKIAAIEVQPE